MTKILLTTVLTSILLTSNLYAKEGVILLHGLCRTPTSMSKMCQALKDSGYVVENVAYPSRTCGIEKLAKLAIAPALNNQGFKDCTKIHFVTHSLGGILVRSYFKKRTHRKLGKVVMLSPPNQGREVVDKIGSLPIVQWINGPAGSE